WTKLSRPDLSLSSEPASGRPAGRSAAARAGARRTGVNRTAVICAAGSEVGNGLPEACDRKSAEAKNTDMTQPSRGKYSEGRRPAARPFIAVFLRYFSSPFRDAAGRCPREAGPVVPGTSGRRA